MRYFIAGIISVLLFIAGAMYCVKTEQAAKKFLKAKIRNANDGRLPADQDRALDDLEPFTPQLLSWMTQVPEPLASRAALSYRLRDGWFLWTLLCCAVMFGTAHLMSPKAPQQEKES